MELVKLRQEDDSEFKANLGYIVSLRSAYAKEQDCLTNHPQPKALHSVCHFIAIICRDF